MAVEVIYPTLNLKDTSYVLDLVSQTLDAIDRFSNTATAVSGVKIDPLSDVEDCLKRLDELFSDADEEIQSEIISVILSRPCSLRTLYKFAEKVYNGGSYDISHEAVPLGM